MSLTAGTSLDGVDWAEIVVLMARHSDLVETPRLRTGPLEIPQTCWKVERKPWLAEGLE